MKKLLIIALFGLSPVYAQTYDEARAGIAAGDDILQYKALQTHALYPYLAERFYRQQLHRDSEIVALFDRYFSAPPIKALHNRWIKDSYQRGNFNQIVRYYYHTGDKAANCLYRDAQLQLGNRQAALENIEQLWLSPRSISSACDTVFTQWSGSTSPTYLLKRARLAYHAGNVAFAERLANKVSGVDAETIRRFAMFYRYPTDLLEVSAESLTATRLARDLLPKALLQLVRKDSSRYAAFAMQFALPMQDNAEYQTVLGQLTGYLANRQDPQTQYAYGLLQNPDKTATRAVIRYLVGARQWQTLAQLINPDSSDTMAQYWLGRALENIGKNPQKAYAKAAKTRSYYGFLAADKLGQAYQLNAESIQPDATVQKNLNHNTVLVRAKLLLQYGEPILARKEILLLAKHMQPYTQQQLAYWLDQNNFSFEAIYVLGKIRKWNDISIRFPTPYNHQVQAANRLTGTPVTWIYAILRQESSMNPRAVSRAKAKGLMQLIPSTARRMADDLQLSLYGDAIFDPSVNTKLGAKYLADMFERFGNIALASAAYNAGPRRVEQWLASNELTDMPLWVEQIPFNETRKYVKRILEYQQVYAHHLGETIPRVSEIMQGRTSDNSG
ncbi:MAG: hypothetical protein CSA45_01690 [Gammaproteobacteria bacterium]|nr:MAG: hypothetical protein CSA45_01690 [Gammaproteobacteria bacterium]